MPASRLQDMLRELELIDDETYKMMRKVKEIRNQFLHDILISAMLFNSDEAQDAIRYAKHCIEVLAS